VSLLALLGARAAAGGGLTTVAEDTFTRADSTSLGSTEIGSFAWTEHVGNIEIKSNAVNAVYANGQNHAATFDSGESDVTVTANVSTSTTGDRTVLDVMLRYVNASNWVAMGVRDESSRNTLILHRNVAGAESTVASYAAGFGPNENHEIVAVCSGTSIEVFLNGVSRISTTVSDHSTATRQGVRWFTNATTDNGTSTVKDIKVEV
jgi:hypothetical protein